MLIAGAIDRGVVTRNLGVFEHNVAALAADCTEGPTLGFSIARPFEKTQIPAAAVASFGAPASRTPLLDTWRVPSSATARVRTSVFASR